MARTYDEITITHEWLARQSMFGRHSRRSPATAT